MSLDWVKLELNIWYTDWSWWVQAYAR